MIFHLHSRVCLSRSFPEDTNLRPSTQTPSPVVQLPELSTNPRPGAYIRHIHQIPSDTWSQESIYILVKTWHTHCPMKFPPIHTAPSLASPATPTRGHLLQLLQGCLHGLHLLEMAGHVCGQHHLDDQSPQLLEGTEPEE